MGLRNAFAPTAFSIVRFTATGATASGGTLTLNYPSLFPLGSVNPTLKNRGHFFGNSGHKLSAGNNDYLFPRDFELTFNSTNITLTWRGASPLPAGSDYRLQLEEAGHTPQVDARGGTGNVTGVIGPNGLSGQYIINLTSPAAAAANNICLAQARAAAGNATLNGTLVAGGIAYMDAPRGVQIVSTNAGDTTQTATVRGFDQYGQAMTEVLTFNGTTARNGVKAFWQINSIAISAALTGNLTVGTNTVLGLPVFLPTSGYVMKELQDGVTATAGTFVNGAIVTPTSTSADVRGTYVPNSAPDGSRQYQLMLMLNDPGQIGGPQFAG